MLENWKFKTRLYAPFIFIAGMIILAFLDLVGGNIWIRPVWIVLTIITVILSIANLLLLGSSCSVRGGDPK